MKKMLEMVFQKQTMKDTGERKMWKWKRQVYTSSSNAKANAKCIISINIEEENGW